MSSSRKFIGKKVIIYPSNLDSSQSKGKGRKISISNAVSKPSVKEIIMAAERLGLEPILEQKKYPRKWWEETERVVVNKAGSKRDILKRISAELKRIREEKSLSSQ
ncbi:MAG: signal recognition particle subunit SRP19/SEC65 family protein [Fervidicoccaceae archaeon]